MKNLKKIFVALLVATVFGEALWANQNCSSAEQRDPIDQLDCFCPNGELQKQVQQMGPLAEAVKLPRKVSCEYQVTAYLLHLKKQSPDIDLSQAGGIVQEKLQSLSVPNSAGLVANSVGEAEALSGLGMTGSTGSSSFNIQIGPDGFNFSITSGSGGVPHIRANLQNLMDFVEVLLYPDSNIFTLLERVRDYSARYQVVRINGCVAVDDSSSQIFKCLDSKASDGRIVLCGGLERDSMYKSECVYSKMGDAGVRSCNQGFDDNYYFGECMKTSGSPTKINSCTQSTSDNYYRLECLKSKTDGANVSACSEARMDNYYTNECLKSGADQAVIRACGSADLDGYYFNECIKSRAAADLISACASARLDNYYFNECVKSRADAQKVNLCASTGLDGYSFNECLKQRR